MGYISYTTAETFNKSTNTVHSDQNLNRLKNESFSPFFLIYKRLFSTWKKKNLQIYRVFIWKLLKWNGCRTKKLQFCPYVGKANMCLRSSRFFSILENFLKIFSCLVTILRKIYYLSKTLWFYKYRVKSSHICWQLSSRQPYGCGRFLALQILMDPNGS